MGAEMFSTPSSPGKKRKQGQEDLVSEAARMRRNAAREACAQLAMWRCRNSPKGKSSIAVTQDASYELSFELLELRAANRQSEVACADAIREVCDLRAQSRAYEELCASQNALHAAELERCRTQEEASVQRACASTEKVKSLETELQKTREALCTELENQRAAHEADLAQRVKLLEVHSQAQSLSELRELQEMCDKRADEIND